MKKKEKTGLLHVVHKEGDIIQVYGIFQELYGIFLGFSRFF